MRKHATLTGIKGKKKALYTTTTTFLKLHRDE